MGKMGVLDQDARLEVLLENVDDQTVVEPGLENSTLIKTPLVTGQYWIEDGILVITDNKRIVGVHRAVEVGDILSLIYEAQKEIYMVNVRETDISIIAKVYQLIPKADMHQYADYITSIDDKIWVSIGLRPTPYHVNPDRFREELRAEVVEKLCYLRPEFKGIEHKFIGGSIIFEKRF